MLSTIGAKVSEVELDGGPITSMSALGHKQTFRSAIAMSALPSIATSIAFFGIPLRAKRACAGTSACRLSDHAFLQQFLRRCFHLGKFSKTLTAKSASQARSNKFAAI
jgi:hypothetical protein